MDPATNKAAALNWLRLATSGRIDEAYARYVDMTGVHHNAYFPAGLAALRDAQKASDQTFPNKKFEVQRAVAEGDLVGVHSRVELEAGRVFATMHIFRFAGGKVVELWDFAQEQPNGMPNRDGMF